MSPELGTSSGDTYTFFIKKESALLEVLRSNFKWIFFTMGNLHSQMSINVADITNQKDNTKILNYRLKNNGLSQAEQTVIKVHL